MAHRNRYFSAFIAQRQLIGTARDCLTFSMRQRGLLERLEGHTVNEHVSCSVKVVEIVRRKYTNAYSVRVEREYVYPTRSDDSWPGRR